MFRKATTAAALLAALALPIAANAATTSSAEAQQYTFETHLTQAMHAGEYGGTLHMTIEPNGIITGWYRPSDGGVRNVTGGLSGNQIWFDIGGIHALHLEGTFKNGVIDAAANVPGPDPFTLHATIAPHH
jgi:hypothetical protein